MNERRIRRSQDPYRALCLQLEHSRSQGQLDAVVVAIDNGLLVAGAGERSVCEALSAVAPLMSSPSFNGRLPGAIEGQSVDVREVYLDGETVYVASVGRGCGDEWLQQSITGVRRILGYAPLSDAQLLIN
ncbi:MAG: hypothetical protein ACERNK_06070 [Deltaproteobacteria bacterium]